MLLLTTLSTSEIITVAAIIGAISGYFFRNKNSKNGVLIGLSLGLIGGVIMNLLLLTILFKGYIIIPIYSILGSWLFNFTWSKVKK